jgi:hypothetical protein
MMAQSTKVVLFHCFSDRYNPSSILEAVRFLDDCDAVFCNSYYSSDTINDIQSKGSMCYQWEAALLEFVKNGAPRTLESYEYSLTSKLDVIHYQIIARQFLRHITVKLGQKSLPLLVEYMLQYYHAIIRKHQIMHIICAENPHCFGDYILVGLAAILGIPCVSIKYLAQTGRKLSTIYDLIGFKHISTPSQSVNGNLYPEGAVRDLIEVLRNPTSPGTPPYLSSVLASYQKELLSGTSSLKSKSSEGFKYNDIICDISSRKRFIKHNCYRAEHFNNLMLLCLHYEYEASTCPDAGSEYDQQIFALSLSQLARKLGYTILLREHPDQLRGYPGDFEYMHHSYGNTQTTSRPEYFYHSLLSLPCVAGFSDPSESINDIFTSRPGRLIVASLTGSVLLQAACLGIATVSASSHYLHAAGITYSVLELNEKTSVLSSPLEARIPIVGNNKSIFVECLSPWLFRSDFVGNTSVPGSAESFSRLIEHILSTNQ